jgi:hypothetical protein
MPIYIRVVSDDTGHEYDVDEQSLRPGMTPIEGYPPNSGPGARPRPAKYRVDKTGQPARRRARMTTPPPVDPAAVTAPTPEGQHR